jgi:hypothetical protein
MLNSDRAASEASWAMADGSSGDFGLASVGTGDSAGVLRALELARTASRAVPEFEAGSAKAGTVAVPETAEVTVGILLEAG